MSIRLPSKYNQIVQRQELSSSGHGLTDNLQGAEDGYKPSHLEQSITWLSSVEMLLILPGRFGTDSAMDIL